MKKILVALALCLGMSLSAQAQFFVGMRFGVFTDGTGKVATDGTATRGISAFNFSVKPSVGYYFTPKLVAGLKLDFTSCSYVKNDGFSVLNLRNYAMNALMGNDIFDKDYMSWKALPYVRYQVISFAGDKVKIWAELTGHIGMSFSRNDEHKVDPNDYKMLYGASLHPIVSYDLNDRYMLYTSLDFFSLYWEGSTKRINTESGVEIRRESSFIAQSNPLVAVAQAVIGIGVMRKF